MQARQEKSSEIMTLFSTMFTAYLCSGPSYMFCIVRLTCHQLGDEHVRQNPVIHDKMRIREDKHKVNWEIQSQGVQCFEGTNDVLWEAHVSKYFQLNRNLWWENSY